MLGKIKLEEYPYMFIISADSQGKPHGALAKEFRYFNCDRQCIEIMDFFCPITLMNVSHNKNVALLLWTCRKKCGYQLTGSVHGVEHRGILDGYLQHGRNYSGSPQMLYHVTISIEKESRFSYTVHDDCL